MAAIKQAHLSLLVLVLATLALSLVAHPSMTFVDPTTFPTGSGGLVEDMGGDEAEMMMDSESSRRIMRQTRYKSKYISYAAMSRDNIPCGIRGKSYYNCGVHTPARPYRRGCSKITHCARQY